MFFSSAFSISWLRVCVCVFKCVPSLFGSVGTDICLSLSSSSSSHCFLSRSASECDGKKTCIKTLLKHFPYVPPCVPAPFLHVSEHDVLIYTTQKIRDVTKIRYNLNWIASKLLTPCYQDLLHNVLFSDKIITANITKQNKRVWSTKCSGSVTHWYTFSIKIFP